MKVYVVIGSYSWDALDEIECVYRKKAEAEAEYERLMKGRGNPFPTFTIVEAKLK